MMRVASMMMRVMRVATAVALLIPQIRLEAVRIVKMQQRQLLQVLNVLKSLARRINRSSPLLMLRNCHRAYN